MPFDAFTIAALTDELSQTILGGRVQAVIDLDEHSIGFEIYAGRQRHYLVLSAHTARPRAHLAPAKLRRGAPKPSQLGLLCRRHLIGARITSLAQPAWERMLEIHLETSESAFRLVVELMPRRANLLLIHGDIILDCLNRVGPEMNRYRLSLPNHKYVPPPPIKNQAHPAALSQADLQSLLHSAGKPTTQTRRLLPGKILGISPLLAKEIVHRATGDPATSAHETDSAALHTAFREVLLPLLQRRWQPGTAATSRLISEFSVYPLSHLDWQPADSLSAAINTCFGAWDGGDAYETAKQPVAAALNDAETGLQSKLASLRDGLRDAAELERLRQSGELILAYQYSLSQGQTELRAQYQPDSPELIIQLNAAQSPLENAQAFFRRYEKAKAARAAVPALISETETELAYLAQLKVDLELANNWPEIDDIAQALQARGLWRGSPQQRIGGGRSGPLRIVSRDGYVIWVGRNSRQNATVTFKTANAQDIWLHARDVPGAHVIIRHDGRRIPPALIEAAAAVAAWYSARRSDSRVPVDYTRVKHVRSIKGAGPGMVTYRNQSSLNVKPANESILR